MISANINNEQSSHVEIIAQRLLKYSTQPDAPCILALQETRFWDTPCLTLPGFVIYGRPFGLATLLVSDRFFKIKRSWCTEERCTAVLFGSVMVMSVYAPDCKKELKIYEKFVEDAKKILREGRREGAKSFYIAGDLNVELGLLCTGDDDVDEINEMYGPLCWQNYDNDAGGHKK